MEDDAAMLALLEWAERTLEDMDRERDCELRAEDGQPITQGNQ